ncbi:hypothetical protein B0H10DRAFT_1941975 [Mycena sp. CBHHK59/15]|nr:hypothetical protein B0H10DRAFT_1941975 [Mycena sp. CBHHK59/15]
MWVILPCDVSSPPGGHLSMGARSPFLLRPATALCDTDITAYNPPPGYNVRRRLSTAGLHLTAVRLVCSFHGVARALAFYTGSYASTPLDELEIRTPEAASLPLTRRRHNTPCVFQNGHPRVRTETRRYGPPDEYLHRVVVVDQFELALLSGYVARFKDCLLFECRNRRKWVGIGANGNWRMKWLGISAGRNWRRTLRNQSKWIGISAEPSGIGAEPLGIGACWNLRRTIRNWCKWVGTGAEPSGIGAEPMGISTRISAEPSGIGAKVSEIGAELEGIGAETLGISTSGQELVQNYKEFAQNPQEFAQSPWEFAQISSAAMENDSFYNILVEDAILGAILDRLGCIFVRMGVWMLRIK